MSEPTWLNKILFKYVNPMHSTIKDGIIDGIKNIFNKENNRGTKYPVSEDKAVRTGVEAWAKFNNLPYDTTLIVQNSDGTYSLPYVELRIPTSHKDLQDNILTLQKTIEQDSKSLENESDPQFKNYLDELIFINSILKKTNEYYLPIFTDSLKNINSKYVINEGVFKNASDNELLINRLSGTPLNVLHDYTITNLGDSILYEDYYNFENFDNLGSPFYIKGKIKKELKGGKMWKPKQYKNGGLIYKFKEGYKIQSGDTFSGIAKKHGITLEELIAANPNIKNYNLLQLNLEINIPKPKPRPLKENEVILQKGESPASLAKKHGYATGDFQRANPNSKWIVGDTIQIPTTNTALKYAEYTDDYVPSRNWDETSPGKLINYVENKDSIGYKVVNGEGRWYASTRKGDDPNNRGMGIDIKTSGIPAKFIQIDEDGNKYITEKNERRFRFFKHDLNNEQANRYYEDELKRLNNEKGAVSHENDALVLNVMYHRGITGGKNQLKKTGANSALFTGNMRDYIDVLFPRHPERIRLTKEFLNIK